MEVVFLAKFNKDLDKISDTQIKMQVIRIIEEIELAKKLSDLVNVKKLSGFKAAYRIKLGDYRIGFFFENDTIELARIVHRKDIYKVFP
ncbi:MAG: type II toxin-antitoxin system RelE/ParE family toxin [Candidatus Kapabacteria bacterium]|nr:type II toxin-antitoxin system RelE/ParE family toxin [Candidatus Kapabacteria bacterium]